MNLELLLEDWTNIFVIGDWLEDQGNPVVEEIRKIKQDGTYDMEIRTGTYTIIDRFIGAYFYNVLNPLPEEKKPDIDIRRLIPFKYEPINDVQQEIEWHRRQIEESGGLIDYIIVNKFGIILSAASYLRWMACVRLKMKTVTVDVLKPNTSL